MLGSWEPRGCSAVLLRFVAETKYLAVLLISLLSMLKQGRATADAAKCHAASEAGCESGVVQGMCVDELICIEERKAEIATAQ